MGPGLFRLLLATVVVVFHYSSFGIGSAAVLLFFVLSGFWIGRMWDSKYRYLAHPYSTFVAARYLRIWPIFLICSAIAVGIQAISGIPAPLSAAELFPSLFVLGYNSATFAPLYPAWSLDIELQFYLIAPALFFALNKAPARTMGAALSISAIGLLSGGGSILNYLPFFAVGMVSAQHPERWIPSSMLARASAAMTVATIIMFHTVPSLRPFVTGGAAPRPEFLQYNGALNVLIAVMAIPFALSTVVRKSDKADHFYADLSFSVYLFHTLPLAALSHFAPQMFALSTPVRLVLTATLLALMYLASAALTMLWDRPINRMRTNFVVRRRPADTAANG